ncbi:MAG TPA: DUF3040 domain-containing protein [Streptosporangiaceae bacterium]|nr:DUF3040 domain-containing protein [Streptosporangiaceae bacterium]
MGLSMEERRILWEIEQELTRAEPGLAVRLSNLGRPRSSSVLRSRRARAAWMMLVVGIIVLLAYTLFTLHATPRPVNTHMHQAPVQPGMVAAHHTSTRALHVTPVGVQPG